MTTEHSRSYTSLALLLDEATRRQILNAAFARWSESTLRAKGPVDALLKVLPAPGFRRAADAPPVRRAQALESGLLSNGLVLQGILAVWLEGQRDLQAALRTFLAEHPLSVLTPGDLPVRLSHTWQEGRLDALTSDVCAQHPEFGREEVALGLCLLTSHAPPETSAEEDLEAEGEVQDAEDVEFLDDLDDIPTEDGGNAREGDTDARPKLVTVVQALLSVLAELDPDDPALDDVLPLVDRLADTTRLKAAERDDRRRALGKALDALRQDRREDLGYFGYDCGNWDVSHVSSGELTEVVDDVVRFERLLDEHQQTQQRTTSTLVEDRQKREDLGAIESQLAEVFGRLARAFESAEPVPPGDGKHTLPPPEVGETPGASPGKTEADHTPTTSVDAPQEADDDAPDDKIAPESAPQAFTSTRDEPPSEEPTEVKQTTGDPGTATTPPAEPESRLARTPVVAPPAPAPPMTEESKRPEATTADDAPDEVAGQSATPDEDPFDTLQWRLLTAGDVAGAYWLARGREHVDATLPVPSWLLLALQGSLWLRDETDPIVWDLLGISSAYSPTGTHHALLGLAAALKPTLIAPASGLVSWLTASPLPALHGIVENIREFAGRGRALHPDDVVTVKSGDQLEGDIAAVRAEAKLWLDQAEHWSTKTPKGTDAWTHFVRTELNALLGPVVADSRDALRGLDGMLANWRKRDFVLAHIQKAYREQTGRRSELVGEPRDQLLRWTADACDIATRWRNTVDRLKSASDASGWYAAQVNALRTRTAQDLPAALASLRELASSAPPNWAGTARCVEIAIEDLAMFFQLELAAAKPAACPSKSAQAPESRPLERMIAGRLLYLPGVRLGDDGQPVHEGLDQVARLLEQQPEGPAEPKPTLDVWVSRQDFRFTDDLLAQIDDPADASLLRESVDEAESRAVADLRLLAKRVQETVEQGVVDGVIGDADRAEYAARIEAQISSVNRNLGERVARLRAISVDLEEARQQHLSEQQTRWKGFQEMLASAHLTDDKKRQLTRRMEQAFADVDTRLIDEFLAGLPEALATGTLPASWFQSKPEQSAIEAFTQALPSLEEAVKRGWSSIIASGKRGEWAGALRAARSLPRPIQEEVIRTFEAWRTLKGSAIRDQDARKLLLTIMTFLGFKATMGSASLTVARNAGDWVHVSARLSDREMSLVPQFGSLTHGAYEVVCVWERPGTDTIGAWLRELRLDTHPTILVYLARLTPTQRRAITRMARRSGLALLALDEALLLYLAGERDARLQTFMECTLPFAAVNPFTPFQAGDVPPEMFFGRSAMIRDLLSPQGSCIVYGGRQLGKSALLRAVQRKFADPAKEHVACVLDIKLVGDPQAGLPPEAVWPRFRDALKEAGVLGRRVTTDNYRELHRHVTDWLKSSQSRRLLVMLDEADNLLDADSRNSFPVVTALRDLMVSTSRRFKAVLTGLHNVQRFQGIPNQPLAHFGRIPVGPLEADAAFDLVDRSFRHLGYVFDSPGTILRVLSYTNYHAGLIQLFCQELLKRLQQAAEREPPFVIGQGDVEAVYRDRSVQDGIRDRLDWTLSLDTRYQAIAWSLIVDQMQTRNGYSRPYSAPDVLKLVTEAWSAGFSEMSSDDLRGWLDEMCGLGILVRGNDRLYRLRSPNLVHLMGREEDIFGRLVELGNTPPRVVFEADRHRPLLGDKPVRYSPFTHAQERQLGDSRSGVGLVYATTALGLDRLPDVFHRLLPERDRDAGFHEVPAEDGGPGIAEALQRHVSQHAGRQALVVQHRVGGDAGKLEATVEAAVRFCREHGRSPRHWIRVLLVFDGEAALAWARIPALRRQALEAQADVTLAPRRWDVVGIRQLLEHQQKLHTGDAIRMVAEATGGWPWLIDTLNGSSDRDDDIRPEAKALTARLADRGDDLVARFRSALGVAHSEEALRVLRCIRLFQDDGLQDDLVSEFIDGNPPIEPELCLGLVEALVRCGCVERRPGGGLAVEPRAAHALLGPIAS